MNTLPSRMTGPTLTRGTLLCDLRQQRPSHNVVEGYPGAGKGQHLPDQRKRGSCDRELHLSPPLPLEVPLSVPLWNYCILSWAHLSLCPPFKDWWFPGSHSLLTSLHLLSTLLRSFLWLHMFTEFAQIYISAMDFFPGLQPGLHLTTGNIYLRYLQLNIYKLDSPLYSLSWSKL